MSMKSTYSDLGIKGICARIKRGEMTFDNVVQRKLCWDNEKKSLLIHSVLCDFPIPPLYCKKTVNDKGKSILDALDGKQRSNAFYDFIYNGLVLSDIPEVMVEDEETGEEEPIDISGYTFEELPNPLKNKLETATLRIYQFEDITDDEVAELFFRLNNGKPLSTFELTRAKALSRDKFIELGQHPIFKASLSAKQIGSYANEDTVVKSLILLNEEKKSLDGKDVRKVTAEMEVTEDMASELTNIFDTIIKVHDFISPMDENGNVLNTVSKNDKKIAKRIYTRTHMVSIVPIIKRAIEEQIDIEELAIWLKTFFDGGNKTSISESYNSVVKQGANKESSVNKRLEALEKNYNEVFHGATVGETETEEKEEVEE